MGIATRLDRLDRALPGGGPPRDPVLFWMLAPDAPEPPEWANGLIRDRALESSTEVVIVEPLDDTITAQIGTARYRVTPAGLEAA